MPHPTVLLDISVTSVFPDRGRDFVMNKITSDKILSGGQVFGNVNINQNEL